MKCIVDQCHNFFHQGTGIFIAAPEMGTEHYSLQFICGPCWKAITRPAGEAQYSQVFRNMKEIANQVSPVTVKPNSPG